MRFLARFAWMRLGGLGLLVLFLALANARPACAAATPTEAAAMRAAERDHTAYTLPPDKLQKAEALARTRHALTFGRVAWDFVVLVLLLALGVAARMRTFAVNLSRNRWTQGYVFFFQLLLAITVLELPWSIFGHHAGLAYGLSVQGWGSWLGDEAKSFAIAYGLGGLGVMLLFFFIRRFPRRWWLAMAVSVMAASLVGVFLVPYVVDPLFNRFEPLSQSNPALVAQLKRVVAKGKGIAIPPERMFLMHASDKVTTMNAYVTGFGASKRIVVWDTSIRKGTPDEILLIFGHEMGHYVLGHVVSGLLLSFAGILVAFFLGFHAFRVLLRRFGPRWGIFGQEDWASVVVLILVFNVLTFLGEPIENAISRADEHAADVYGQEVVHGIVADPQATGQASFQRLGESSYDEPDPSPLVEFWYGSHPPIWLRAAFAKHYNPWAPGETPRYFNQ